MQNKPVISVVAAAFINKKEVALFQRAVGDIGAGLFEFPGGKIENLETKQQALQREMMEELQVQVTVGEFIACTRFETAHKIIELFLYEIVNYKPEKFTLNEHICFKWVSQQDKWPDLVPADIPLMNEVFSFLNKKTH